jgi:hypothetical protein
VTCQNILSSGKLIKRFSNNAFVDCWLAPKGAAEMLRGICLEVCPRESGQNCFWDLII